MSEPTPAELAAQPPQTTAEPTPAEIAMQGLDLPQETPPRTEATPAPEAAPEVPEAPEQPQSQQARYEAQLEALMSKARQTREKQVQQAPANPNQELVQALKDLGVAPRPKIDLDKILNPTKEEDKEITELKQKIEQLDNYFNEMRTQQEQTNQQRQQQEMQLAQDRELQSISQFIDTSKDHFQYVAASKPIGSDKDMLQGLVSMSYQGYQPEHAEIADLVEARIEQLIDLVSGTSKFAEMVKDKFGVDLGSRPAPSPTLTEDLRAQGSAEPVDFSQMSDEEQQKYALKQALAAREAALKKFQG